MKHLRISFALLFLALFSATSLSAQFSSEDWDFDEKKEKDDGKKGKISGGMLHLPYTYAASGAADYFQGIRDVSDPAIEGIPGQWGLDAQFVVRNFVVKYGGYRSFSQDISYMNGTNESLGTTFREFGLGYNLYSNRGLLVTATGHLGWFTNRSTVSNLNTQNPTTYGSLLTGSSFGTEVEQKGTYLGGEAGVNYMFGFDEVSGSGIVLGLRVGYNYQVSDQSWESYGIPITGGPDLDHSGVYVRASIGFAGWHRQ